MLYIKNVSAKLIHIGSVMLVPDDKILDEVPEKMKETENINANNYSDIPSVKAMIRAGLLELVDVVYRQKEDEPKIRKEYIEVDKLPEEEEKTDENEEKPSEKVDNEEVAEETETAAPKKTTKRSSKKKAENKE